MTIARRMPGLYVLIALCFGSAFAVLAPPLSGPDEIAHVSRAASIARGALFEQAAGEPLFDREAVFDDIDGDLAAMRFDRAVALAPARVVGVARRQLSCAPLDVRDRNGASAYPPLPYLVAAAAFRLTCALHGPVGAFVYGARLGNLLVATLLAALALRALPCARWSLFVLALLPTTLYQSASFSADSLSNAVTFLWLAYVARLLVDQGLLSARATASGAALAAFMLLCKPGYPLLVLPAVLVSRARFATRGAWRQFVALVVIAPLAIAAAWMYSVRGMLAAPAGVDVQANLEHLRAAPIDFLAALGSAMRDQSLGWVKPFIASMGVLEVPMPLMVYLVVAVLSLLSLSLNARDALPRPAVRVGLVAVALASIVVLALPLYLTFSNAASGKLAGIQGRYFVPVAALAALGLCFDGRRWSALMRPRVVYPLACTLVLLFSVGAFGARYFHAIGSVEDPGHARLYEGRMIRRLGPEPELRSRWYFVEHARRRWVQDAAWMERAGFTPADVIPVPAVVFDAIEEDPRPLVATSDPPRAKTPAR